MFPGKGGECSQAKVVNVPRKKNLRKGEKYVIIKEERRLQNARKRN